MRRTDGSHGFALEDSGDAEHEEGYRFGYAYRLPRGVWDQLIAKAVDIRTELAQKKEEEARKALEAVRDKAEKYMSLFSNIDLNEITVPQSPFTGWRIAIG